ncbi:MAG: hypothetical protein ACRENX_11350 [Candidatus Dormibacteria bacterium]
MTDGTLAGLGSRLRGSESRQRWYRDPAAWAKECLNWSDGQRLTDYQQDILRAVATDHRVAVRTPHGAGKSATAAILMLWHATTRDQAGVSWRCISVAGAWRQLEKFLWPELTTWSRRIKWDVVGRPPFGPSELQTLNLKLHQGQAFAASTDDPALLEGLHGDSVLVVLDEARSIPDATWDSLEGAMAGRGETFALAVTVPGPPAGRFHSICARRAGLEEWRSIHVTLEQSLAAGLVSRDWANARLRQWGLTSAVYQNRVLANFASSDEDSIVPLSWVEAANERWAEWDRRGRPLPDGRRIYGCDVATTGRDSTCILSRQGNVILSVERHHGWETMRSAGEIMQKLTAPNSIAVVDVAGVGAGVVHRLREQRAAVTAFNSSERAKGHDRSGELDFLNRRAEAYWRLRELLDPANAPTLALPADDQLLGDLTTPKWSVNSSGKIQIEAKDTIRSRLGRSTDTSDALAFAMSVRGSSYVEDAAGPAVLPWSEDPPGRNSGVVAWADDGGDDEPIRVSPMWPRADW